MLNKASFLEAIKEGKWYHVKESGSSYLVKIKPYHSDEFGDYLKLLWLSKDDTESMNIQEVWDEDWSIQDGSLRITGADNYVFGLMEELEAPDSIYTPEGELVYDKLKSLVLYELKEDFLVEEEFVRMWKAIEEKDFSKLEVLSFTH